MGRIPACVLLGILLAATTGPVPRVAAQNEAAQQQKAAEFERLWDRLPQITDPEERVAVADEALKLERELQHWPLAVPRDHTRARLWWELGSGYIVRPLGDRADNIERALAAYERALQVLTREALPREWALTHLGLVWAATPYSPVQAETPASLQSRAVIG